MAHGSLWNAGSAWPQTVAVAVLLETLIGGIPGFFEPNPLAFWGTHVRAGRRPRRLLLDRAARKDASRARRLPAHQPLHAPAHGRCRARAHEPDALLRRARHRHRRQAHHGVGRAAAGLPRRAHRRRALLGRRHPLQHADRGGLRRQPAPELADLRRPYVEPGRAGARDDVGGAAPPEGHPVFEPRRRAISRASCRPTACATSSSELVAHIPEAGRAAAPRCASWPATAA